MERLKEMHLRCKGSVSVKINDHRDLYMTVEEYFLQPFFDDDDVPAEVKQKMVELDTIVNIQFYPLTPIGFYAVWHYDLDAALDAALECLNN